MPDKLEQLSLLGERPILGDLTPLTAKLIAPEKSGPPSHLLARVRTPRMLAWATVELASASRDVEAWGRGLQRTLTALAGRIDLREVTSPKALRRRFFDSLLDWRHLDVERDLCRACECWRALAGADGAILWMYNDRAKAYELAAYDIAGNDRRNPREELFELRKAAIGVVHGVGHYASVTAQPVRAPDIRSWSAVHGDVTYRVLLADQLERMGCRGLACVPLLPAPDHPKPEYLDVVTLHFCRKTLELDVPDPSLLTLGRATRQFVQSTHEAQERRVRDRLEQLTKNHLTRTDEAPKKIRDRYLGELIALIQQELRVDGVSIFYRARIKDSIACLASTGLVDPRGREVAASDYPSVSYARGEGWTGECYASNASILYPAPGHDENSGHVARYSEIRKEPTGTEPFLLQPIPTDPASPDKPGAAVGVIRAVGHRSSLFRDQYTQFRPAGMALLRAIAIDVSPILQTLHLRVEREQTISILKHEIKTPLGMILDTSRKVLNDLAGGKTPREVDLRDIEVCAAFGMTVAQQLDADPLTFAKLRRVPVLLEGDIVARVRAMLSHYAREANQMSIGFGDGFRAVPQLNLDRGLIEQALQNLIINAIKYGKRGSHIEIEARPPDSNARYYIVDVINQGIGVEEDEKDKIFLPNYRSPYAMRTAQPGVGLGLSIARQALIAHGGNVYLTKTKDPTIFSLYIPKN